MTFNLEGMGETPTSILTWARKNLQIIDWYKDDQATFERKYGQLQLGTNSLSTEGLRILVETLRHPEQILPDTPYLSDIARMRYDAYRGYVMAELDKRH